MAENNSPGGQPPAQTVPPVAAQPAASSSTVQESFNSTVKSVKSPAEVRAAIQEMTRVLPKPGARPPVVQQPTPEPVAVEATPAPAPEVTTPPASEETPASDVGSEQPLETAPPADQPLPTEEDDGGEGPVTPLTGKRAHIRVPEGEVDKLAMAYLRRNRDWGMEQALDAAKKQLGIKPQVAPEVVPADPKRPSTVSDTQQLIATRRADYKKAMAEVRFEDAADIMTDIQDLQDHRSTLERRADQEEVQKVAKYDSDFTKSESKAVELYPFVTDSASAGAKRMAQIEATLKANEDPLYYSADKPLKLAQMVAAELNIAPRNKNATPAQKAAAPAPAAPAPKKGVVPTGSSRTVPPATSQPAVDPAISGIRNLTDLRTQLRRLGVK